MKQELKKEAAKPLSETSGTPELKDQELEAVVGGALPPPPAAPAPAAGTIHGSRSNVKNNIVTN